MTLSDTTSELRPAVGNACLICAQLLAREGETEKALALCEAVEAADLPEHIRLAATSNAILCFGADPTRQGGAALNARTDSNGGVDINIQGEDGLPLLIEQLNSEEEARFRLALHVARQLDVDASTELAAQMGTQSPSRQALLLIALGDLGNRTVLPTVLEAAKSDEPEVRIEAIHTLGQLGDATVVPVLLIASTDSDEQIASAAQSALAALDSGEIDVAIVDLLKSDDAETRRMAINVAAQRKIASAAPALLELAQSDHSAVRAAAIEALGTTAQLEHLPDLIALAITPRQADEYETILAALKAACVRMPQEECASLLVAAMSGASLDAQVTLLEQLTSVGGATALDALVASAKSNEDALQDTATRLLGGWLTADAAPALHDLAKSLPEGKYQIRALRGYVRIARQLNMSVEERIEVCRNTLAIAERSDDKLLVFEVIRRYPTPEGLTLVVSLVPEEELQTQACETIVSMAGHLAAESPEQVEAALLQVLELSNDPAVKSDAEAALVIAREGIRLQQEEAEFTSVFDGISLEGWTQFGRSIASRTGPSSAAVSKRRSDKVTTTCASMASMVTSRSGWKPDSSARTSRMAGSISVRVGQAASAIKPTWDRTITAACTTK